MEATRIIIQSLEDAKNGKTLIEGVERKNIKHAGEFSVGILEAGTVGGQTSLMFICRTEGSAVVGQMTASQFEMLIGVFRGAVQRFGK